MNSFITDKERIKILEHVASKQGDVHLFFTALKKRVYDRIHQGHFFDLPSELAWYYPAMEYLSDAAMLHHLKPEKELALWINKAALEIANKTEYDWVGSSFRDHSEPYIGHLETAHLCWTLSVVYDLAADVFSKKEQFLIRHAVVNKGIPLCERWLKKNNHLGNWRGIMASGVMVAAVTFDEKETVEKCLPQLQLCLKAFQSDGSYGESLQYGNYLAYAMMLCFEALHRKNPELAASLEISVYTKGIDWIASSMFYQKPLSNWGNEPRARAANFNDSAATFRPSGDLLLHIATRSKVTNEKGIAKWLFEKYYTSVPQQGPHDLASFGMSNDWGFLTLPLLTDYIFSISPEQADLAHVKSFSNGHSFMRDAWEGKTIIAVNGGGDAINAPGHLHGDINSFLVVHNQERLLVDPGHSCYRNLIHGLESASQTHSTCTFLVANDALGLQEDLAKAVLLEQSNVPQRRQINGKTLGAAIDRGNKLLLSHTDENVSVIGSEAAKLYGDPIKSFKRFLILVGSNLVFVIDEIEATQPVKTIWNWLVNNQDGKTQTYSNGYSFIARRGNAGMKLFHAGEGKIGFPVNAFVHDAYHVEASQLGEGKSGSGLLFRFTEILSQHTRTVVHAIALDEADTVNLWQLEKTKHGVALGNGDQQWELQWDEARKNFAITDGDSKRWEIVQQHNGYELKKSKYSSTKNTLSKALLLLAFCFVCLGSWAQLPEYDKQKIHLYVLAGQSNMAGNSAVEEVDRMTHPRVWMLDGAQHWVLAKNPMRFDKNIEGVSPGLSFAKFMAAKDSTSIIGLIPCAVGGTGIDLWTPGAYDDKTKTHPYDDALNRILLAKEYGVVKGILWHQGESDSKKELTEAYEVKLKKVFLQFRSDLNDSDLPIVLGTLGDFLVNKNPYAGIINKSITTVASQLSFSGLADASGLTDAGDRLHFNAASSRALGERYAQALLQIKKNNKAE